LNPKPQQAIPSIKRLGFNLVSNKNLSEKLPSSCLGPEPDEECQKGLKLLHLWCHSQKIHNPKPVFFHCWLEDFPSLLRVGTAL